MKTPKWILLLLAMLFASLAGAVAQSDVKPSRAEVYCTQHSGQVVDRVPYYGTNDANPLRLAGSHKFCQFTSNDGSRIHVLLSTLYAAEPTLAALAYYAQVPFDGTGCFGNPGSCYCSQLGGTDLFGGKNLAGGGWVTTDPNNVDQTLEACVFPDLSIIDSWGLTYHSAGIIRGRNLKKVLRYKDPFATARTVFPKKP
jgi:putative hemolysin